MDIRRTILWMIFSFSLLLLWNNWQVYNGQPSLFSGKPANTQQAGSENGSTNGTAKGSAGVPDAGVPMAADTASGTAATGVPAAGGASSQAAAESEKITITTDVYNLVFDTQGAQMVRAELLKFGDEDDPDKPMVLLNNQPGSTYLAQTGIVGAPQGETFPTHLTPFRLVSSERSLTGDTLDVAFEAESGNARVVKTFTFHRGR